MTRILSLPREGDIVVVTAKLSERIRKQSPDQVGTCVMITEDHTCAVLFSDGEMWWGTAREVYPQAE